MSGLPFRTRLYTVLLVLATVTAMAGAWVFLDYAIDRHSLVIAGILLVMILAAEVLDVSFPSSVITFHVSVSAAFCFAAGLTAGPVLGCLVVALAHTLDGLIVRREAIKIVVNATGLGLSTLLSGLVYFRIADAGASTIGSLQNLLAA
ncbi:MAG: hypothetical protein KC432_11195, partial [Thermomicrobiales bacterium]|nr:hypothetical protein [Thermomicrobiales bacterium]